MPTFNDYTMFNNKVKPVYFLGKSYDKCRTR